jgi:uncharacterized protein (TIGR00290 family)
MIKYNVFHNWSGGKDSAMALYKMIMSKRYHVSMLVTTLGDVSKRVTMHGISEAMLDLQAESLGIPLRKVFISESADILQYNKTMQETFSYFKSRNIFISSYGDIFLEDIRRYREEELHKSGLKAYFPLWNISTSQLAEEFISRGFKAVVVCTDSAMLDKSFCGREYNKDFIADLPASVDPCGENGEFHTFVYDGPVFKRAVRFHKGDVVLKNYTDTNGNYSNSFYFMEITPYYLSS